MPEIDTVLFCYDIFSYVKKGYESLGCGNLGEDRFCYYRIGEMDIMCNRYIIAAFYIQQTRSVTEYKPKMLLYQTSKV